MGQTFDCFGNSIEFTQSHRPEEAIPNSCDTSTVSFGENIIATPEMRHTWASKSDDACYSAEAIG